MIRFVLAIFALIGGGYLLVNYQYERTHHVSVPLPDVWYQRLDSLSPVLSSDVPGWPGSIQRDDVRAGEAGKDRSPQPPAVCPTPAKPVARDLGRCPARIYPREFACDVRLPSGAWSPSVCRFKAG